MVPYLTNTQNRLWAIFEQTVPSWSTLVRPGNEVKYTGNYRYPPKALVGVKAPGDFAEVSIKPVSSVDQAYASPMARTFGSMDKGSIGGPGTPIIMTERTVYEVLLSFADLQYQAAATLYQAMRTAMLNAGPHLALVAPANPTAPGYSYIESWGPFPFSCKENSPKYPAKGLAMACNLTVNYRFQTTDLLA